MCAPPSETPKAICDDIDDFLHQVHVLIYGRGEELGLEVFGRRQVEHHINRMLAALGRRLAQGQAFEVLVLGLDAIGDDDLVEVAGDQALARHLILQCFAAARIAELFSALLDRTGGRFPPRVGIVEQVPVLKGEAEAGIGGDALSVNAQALLTAALQPFDSVAMAVRETILRRDRFEHDRTAADLGEGLEMLRVGLRIPARQRQLLEAFAALAEDLCHLDAGLVVHQIGIHRRAVVVALHRRGTIRHEPLRGPSAGTRVHRFIEQTAHGGVLGVGRHTAGLGLRRYP